MAKAQAQLTGYLFTILMGVVFLVAIISILFYFYDVSLRNEVEQELKQLVIMTSDSITRLYSAGKSSKTMVSNYSSALISKIELNLPSSISSRNYEILLIDANPIWQSVNNLTANDKSISSVETTSGAKIIARTTQDPIESFELTIPNMDVGLQGKSENGKNSELSYYRYNINGTAYDKIVLGESGILISIENMS